MDDLRLPIGKSCSKCGEWKLLEEFHKAPRYRLGHASICKECAHLDYKRRAQREKSMPERKRCTRCGVVKPASKFRANVANPTGLTPSCTECARAQDARRYRDNDGAAQRRTHREANPEMVRAATARYREKHKDTIATRQHEYRERHRERLDEYIREYRRQRPWLSAIYGARRREYMANGNGLAAEEWRAICERYGNVCLCCGAREELTVDHVVPLSLGGLHQADNVQPLCKPCNSRKSANVVDYRY